LRLFKEHDDTRLKWREQIERASRQAQSGQVVDGEEVFRTSAPDDPCVRFHPRGGARQRDQTLEQPAGPAIPPKDSGNMVETGRRT
jgi:hypothetical protein